MSIPTPPQRTFETRPCVVPGCIDLEHDYLDGVMDDECRCISIGDGTTPSEIWFVSGYRDEQTGLWEVFANVDLDESTGLAGLIEAERYVLAYRTVLEHCTTLNALERSKR